MRIGPEHHPLFRAVQGKAVVEQLGPLLTPVAGPVAARGAVAVEAGKDVEGVGSGHVVLLSAVDRCGYRLGTTAKFIAIGPATALCRRILFVTPYHSGPELHRCNDSAQL